MPQNPNQPFGTLLGLPAGVSTADQLTTFKRKDEAEKFARRMKEASAGMTPQDSIVFNQFAQLGNMLGNKIGGQPSVQFTPDEEQGLVAMEAFNENVDGLRQTPEWEKMSPEDKGFAQQEAMVAALQKAGDQETALAMAADLHSRRREARIQNAQARKLEAEATTEEGEATPGPAARASAVAEFHGDLYSATEKKQHRELIQSSDQMTRIADNMISTFDKAGDPRDVVGSVGGINQVVNSIGQVFKGGLRTMRSFGEVNADGLGVGRGRTPQEWTDTIPDDIVPSKIRNNAQQAAAYKAAIMQMVYADARLNEPGARQLSDADITNAMVRLGVNNNDPQAVVDVFFTNMDDRLAVTSQKFNDIAATMEPVGGAATLRTVYGRDVLGDLATKREQIGAIRGRGQQAVNRVEAPVTPGAPTQAVTPAEQALLDRYLTP